MQDMSNQTAPQPAKHPFSHEGTSSETSMAAVEGNVNLKEHLNTTDAHDTFFTQTHNSGESPQMRHAARLVEERGGLIDPSQMAPSESKDELQRMDPAKEGSSESLLYKTYEAEHESNFQWRSEILPQLRGIQLEIQKGNHKIDLQSHNQEKLFARTQQLTHMVSELHQQMKQQQEMLTLMWKSLENVQDNKTEWNEDLSPRSNLLTNNSNQRQYLTSTRMQTTHDAKAMTTALTMAEKISKTLLAPSTREQLPHWRMQLSQKVELLREASLHNFHLVFPVFTSAWLKDNEEAITNLIGNDVEDSDKAYRQICALTQEICQEVSTMTATHFYKAVTRYVTANLMHERGEALSHKITQTTNPAMRLRWTADRRAQAGASDILAFNLVHAVTESGSETRRRYLSHLQNMARENATTAELIDVDSFITYLDTSHSINYISRADATSVNVVTPQQLEQKQWFTGTMDDEPKHTMLSEDTSVDGDSEGGSSENHVCVINKNAEPETVPSPTTSNDEPSSSSSGESEDSNGPCLLTFNGVAVTYDGKQLNLASTMQEAYVHIANRCIDIEELVVLDKDGNHVSATEDGKDVVKHEKVGKFAKEEDGVHTLHVLQIPSCTKCGKQHSEAENCPMILATTSTKQHEHHQINTVNILEPEQTVAKQHISKNNNNCGSTDNTQVVQLPDPSLTYKFKSLLGKSMLIN